MYLLTLGHAELDTDSATDACPKLSVGDEQGDAAGEITPLEIFACS